MKLYCITCNGYIHFVPGFCKQLVKHWPDQEITVLCYDVLPDLSGLTQAERDMVTVHSLGEQSLYGRSWTDALIPYFSELEDKYFVVMVEDYHLQMDVDMNTVAAAEHHVAIGASDKVDLTGDVVKREHTMNPSDRRFVIADQMAAYRTSLQAAIWTKDYFLGHLKPARTAWDFELMGYREAWGDGAVIEGTREPCVVYKNLVLKGNLLNAGDDGALQSQWDKNATELRTLLADQPIEDFKKWGIVKKTVAVGQPKWIKGEVEAIAGSRWFEHCEDTTDYHQAYHLVRFEELTGIDPRAFGRVVEIGGGYGAMARLWRKVGWNRPYTIIDIPEMQKLQEHYLDGLDVELTGVVPEIGDDTLVIATWSLSELPLADRMRYMPLVAGSGGLLMAAQSEFDGVDNRKCFNIGIDYAEIEHIPGSFYVIGVKGGK